MHTFISMSSFLTACSLVDSDDCDGRAFEERFSDASNSCEIGFNEGTISTFSEKYTQWSNYEKWKRTGGSNLLVQSLLEHLLGKKFMHSSSTRIHFCHNLLLHVNELFDQIVPDVT